MRKAFTILFILVLLVYARQGYLYYMSSLHAPGVYEEGLLSDIAAEVVEIPLKVPGGVRIGPVKNIRLAENDLFFTSDNILYRFTRTGEYVCRITDPEAIRVAGYLVDPAKHQLIVLGNADDVNYYTFDGRLAGRKKLAGGRPLFRMESAAMLGDKIWAIEEAFASAEDAAPGIALKRQVTVYNSSFDWLETKTLEQTDTGRRHLFMPRGYSELLVSPDTGKAYAYVPDQDPEHLLQDTLSILHGKRVESPGSIPVYPVRLGSRFWIASSVRQGAPEENYTFCYDTKRNHSWQVARGFTDDFYGTGMVENLMPADPFGNSYVYSAANSANDTTVYLVKLKS